MHILILAAFFGQDFQVGARAKAMGGSYTAFGDDPIAVWSNPAGIATQPTQFAMTYQSFAQYEFANVGDPIDPATVGDPEQALLDPPISPSFAGVVVQLGADDFEMAACLAYIRPFQIKYVYVFDDIVLGTLLTQTDQQYSRLRAGYGASLKLNREGGFFSRIAAGVGLDFVYTHYKEVDQNPDPASETLVFEDSETAGAYGVGVLATLYESDSFMVDFGAAYNSEVDFHFDLDNSIYPVWDWPWLASAGLAFYVGEAYRLRITLDAQWIGWKHAVGDPDPSQQRFDNTLSLSAGAEVRFQVAETKWIYARAGFKSYDTPWGDRDRLPAVGLSVLQIDTKGDRLGIATLGVGVYWSRKNAEGDVRLSGFDAAVELGGETSWLMGVGYTHQLD